MGKEVKTTVVHVQHEPCDVFIGRPSRWGNPFRIGRDGNRAQVINKYRAWLRRPARKFLRQRAVELLKGKKLGCFCKPEECHGDVLVELIANAGKGRFNV